MSGSTRDGRAFVVGISGADDERVYEVIAMADGSQAKVPEDSVLIDAEPGAKDTPDVFDAVQLEEGFITEILGSAVVQRPRLRDRELTIGQWRGTLPEDWYLGVGNNPLWKRIEALIWDQSDGIPIVLVRATNEPKSEPGLVPAVGETSDEYSALVPVEWAPVEQWAETCRVASDTERVAKARRTQRRDAERSLPTRFVNPYNFVALPTADVERMEPPGHDGIVDSDRMMGAITIRWTAISGMLAPYDAHGERRFERKGQRSLIPGSTIKGAVRSNHEAICSGCMRVLDLDYTPVHREEVGSHRHGWRMAMVVEDRDGDPITMAVSDGVVWVDSRIIKAAKPRVRTGDRFRLDTNQVKRGDLRTTVRYPAPADTLVADTQGDWVVLIADDRARAKYADREKTKEIGAYFALGNLGPQAKRLPVGDGVWDKYRHLAEFADDMRVSRGGQRNAQGVAAAAQYQPLGKNKKFPEHATFERQRVSNRLPTESVVWVNAEGEEVTEISVSQVWRYAGSAGVGKRLGRQSGGVAPCTDIKSLCPTCRVFGTADDRGATKNQQNSYRSHVRFGQALQVDDERPFVVDRLAPMGPPRPSAGQHYLQPKQAFEGKRATVGSGEQTNDPPLAHWGAAPDKPEPRQVRGRKFYWHADPEQQQRFWAERSTPRRRRFEARSDDNSNMTPSAEMLPAGTTFESTVWFENLSMAEIGALLCAIDPSLLAAALGIRAPQPPEHMSGLSSDGYAIHLGGGKAFGLGSISTELIDVSVNAPADRYGSADTERASNCGPNTLVGSFVEAASETNFAVWDQYLRLRHRAWVDPALVWYPPGRKWDDPEPRLFDEPYHYFQATAGRPTASGGGLLSLPTADADDLTQNIITKDGPAS